MSKSESAASSALHVYRLSRSFTQAGNELKVLKNIDIDIKQGEMVALVGPSGAGKSTLLQHVGLLEKPQDGQISIMGEETSLMRDKARTKIRLNEIGFVYQYHHLLPEFSALENVIIPQMIAGKSEGAARDYGLKLLTMLGLSTRIDHRPARLSGGEQQRVAIARALANRPSLLLADEPTGNLDPKTAEQVFKLLRKLVDKTNIATLIATHNMELAAKMDRVLILKNGQVTQQKN